MKSKLLQLILIAMLIPVAFATLAQQKKYQRMAMYIAAEDVNAINPPQEKAAAQLFQREFAEFGTILTPKDVDKIKYPDFDCLWINIDSIGKSEGVEKFRSAFISDKFLLAVKKFYQDGGNLYMSKFAIELLYSDGIGLLDDYLRPNVFESGTGTDNNPDIWSINAQIGARMMNDDPSQYSDRRGHPIYAGLSTMSSTEWAATPDPIYNDVPYNVFPMQGNSAKQPIHREDHNCMWRLAMKTDNNAKIGLYVGYDGVHSFDEISKIENPQERAVADFLLNPEGWFKSIRPDVKIEIICPGDIERIDPNNFDCIWVHIDRCGLKKGWTNLPESFRRADLINALENYSRNGGQLLLTKYATQLVPAIGRISEDFAPNQYSSGEGGNGTDVWDVNARIGYWFVNEQENPGGLDPSQYYDHSNHAIYADLQTRNDFRWETYGMEGTGNGAEMWREDHNCMWNLNGYNNIYTADGKNTVERFQNQNNCVVLGTWGHVQDHAVAGIVEFRPTIQYRGRIIANGLAACEWAPRNGGNAYHHNLEQLTFNCLRYLVTVTDFKFVSQGPNGVARFEEDAKATVLGTWGQDWNHQAAGIVEFAPRNHSMAALNDTSDELAELNKNKAKPGTILANGIGCVQLYHAADNNDYKSNTELLTRNIIDYLSPWHAAPVSGVEDVSDTTTGSVESIPGGIRWAGFSRPANLEIYTIDGRLIASLTIEGEGSVDLDSKGIVIVSVGGTVTKLLCK